MGVSMADAERQKLKEARLKAGHMWPLSMAEVQWEVEPLDSWKPNAPNGLLRHGPGDECRLVRLVDVAAWMANEFPRDEVIRRLMGALCQNEADPWGWQLFALNGSGYAKRLIRPLGPSPETVDFWQYLREPDSIDEYDEGVTSDYIARDVMGVIGRMWEYAWPGASADPDADRDWYMRRVIEANKRRNARVKANPDASPHAVPASMLSEERRTMMLHLERLAAPIPVAFTLWGWGQAAAAVALPDAVIEAPAAPAIASRPKTVQELEALLTGENHAAQTVAKAQGRKVRLTPRVWTVEMRQSVRARIDALMLDGDGMNVTDATEWVAACLGVDRSGISQQMTKLATELKAREMQALVKKNNLFLGNG